MVSGGIWWYLVISGGTCSEETSIFYLISNLSIPDHLLLASLFFEVQSVTHKCFLAIVPLKIRLAVRGQATIRLKISDNEFDL